ncbi:MAG: chemotaxis protein CheW [Gemmatimonadales bacterium]|nr:chemotaxis protein CheW [Gemmatimonadales bacterium]
MSSLSSGRVVVCRVGERRFGLSITAVREVCTGIRLAGVPGVAAPVEGVANVRGVLVTVVRAADLLGVSAASAGPSPWLVVLQFRGGRVGVGVDEVLDLEAEGSSVARFDIEGALDPIFGPAT